MDAAEDQESPATPAAETARTSAPRRAGRRGRNGPSRPAPWALPVGVAVMGLLSALAAFFRLGPEAPRSGVGDRLLVCAGLGLVVAAAGGVLGGAVEIAVARGGPRARIGALLALAIVLVPVVTSPLLAPRSGDPGFWILGGGGLLLGLLLGGPAFRWRRGRKGWGTAAALLALGLAADLVAPGGHALATPAGDALGHGMALGLGGLGLAIALHGPLRGLVAALVVIVVGVLVFRTGLLDDARAELVAASPRHGAFERALVATHLLPARDQGPAPRLPEASTFLEPPVDPLVALDGLREGLRRRAADADLPPRGPSVLWLSARGAARDRLAEAEAAPRGLRFTSAWAPARETTAVLESALSGRLPSMGMRDESPPGRRSAGFLPRRFTLAGYRSVHARAGVPEALREGPMFSRAAPSFSHTLDDAAALSTWLRREGTHEGPEGSRPFFAWAVVATRGELERLLESVAAAGLEDDTILVLHGLPEPVTRSRFTPPADFTPTDLRVPLVVAVPGAPRGRTETPMDLSRLAPTLAALAALGAAPDSERPDLAPVLADPEAAWPRHATAETEALEAGALGPRVRAVTDGRFVLVDRLHAGTWRLFGSDDRELPPGDERRAQTARLRGLLALLDERVWQRARSGPVERDPADALWATLLEGSPDAWAAALAEAVRDGDGATLAALEGRLHRLPPEVAHAVLVALSKVRPPRTGRARVRFAALPEHPALAFRRRVRRALDPHAREDDARFARPDQPMPAAAHALVARAEGDPQADLRGVPAFEAALAGARAGEAAAILHLVARLEGQRSPAEFLRAADILAGHAAGRDALARLVLALWPQPEAEVEERAGVLAKLLRPEAASPLHLAALVALFDAAPNGRRTAIAETIGWAPQHIEEILEAWRRARFGGASEAARAFAEILPSDPTGSFLSRAARTARVEATSPGAIGLGLRIAGHAGFAEGEAPAAFPLVTLRWTGEKPLRTGPGGLVDLGLEWKGPSGRARAGSLRLPRGLIAPDGTLTCALPILPPTGEGPQTLEFRHFATVLRPAEGVEPPRAAGGATPLATSLASSDGAAWPLAEGLGFECVASAAREIVWTWPEDATEARALEARLRFDGEAGAEARVRVVSASEGALAEWMLPSGETVARRLRFREAPRPGEPLTIVLPRRAGLLLVRSLEPELP